jgi:DNA-binding beta-propeller fold protein YncE
MLVAATAAALIALCGAALADTGDLTPRNCWADNDSSLENCANYNNGLTGALSVAASPDNKSVYVASLEDDAIVTYDRNPTTGQLAYSGCIDDNDTGTDKCGQTTNGLGDAFSVAVSADNRSVYVASAGDDAVAAFARNLTTGELTPQGCVDDNDAGSGPDTCGQTTNGLGGAASVAVSPNNNSVYVASFSDDAVVRFARNATTSALTPQGCVDDNDAGSGPDTCAQTADGLDGAIGVAVSPNSNSVYVASAFDNAVAIFARNLSTGALTASPGGCVEDEDGAPDACRQVNDGLGAARSVTVSPDNTSVYVASANDSAISRFARNPATGALTPRGCVDDRGSAAEDCAQSTLGLGGARSVAVSADSRSVYATGFNDDAVVGFERITTTGALVSQGCVDDNDTVTDACAQSDNGLDGAASVAVSKDGKSVYVASQFDHALARFNRAP